MENKPLKRVAHLMATMSLWITGVMLVIGTIMGLTMDEFGLFLNPLTPQGAVWTTVGLTSLAVARKSIRRLKRLKDDGLRHEGEEIKVVFGGTVHTVGRGGSRGGARIECVYMNQRGERCLVRSKSYMVPLGSNGSDLAAVVYVDRDDPAVYEVEVFLKGYDKTNVDRDYR
ncbi:MAG: hypothetical protein FWB98_06570 [Defluviitaleaceae bacterium]|nr:hypothetical protein [Defluviitaleaceae bacterium]